MLFWGAFQIYKENMDSSLNPISETWPSSKHQSAKRPFPGQAKQSPALSRAGRSCRAPAAAMGRSPSRALPRGHGRGCSGAHAAPAQPAHSHRRPNFDGFKPFTSSLSDHLERIWKTQLWLSQAVEEPKEHLVIHPTPTAWGWIPARSAPPAPKPVPGAARGQGEKVMVTPRHSPSAAGAASAWTPTFHPGDGSPPLALLTQCPEM